METEAYIGLGSNLGDRELNLLRAVAELGKLPGSRITGLSPFYETSPVGVVEQPAFINAVARLTTRLSSLELLRHLQCIESSIFKRKRTQQWGPRTMDLDLLLFGDEVLTSRELTIPHPRLAERRFVLEPLCKLAPEFRHPVLGVSMTELLFALTSREQVSRI